MKRIILFITIIGFTLSVQSQDWPLKTKVQQQKQLQVPFKTVSAFSYRGSKQLNTRGRYEELDANQSELRELLLERPMAIQLKVPTGNGRELICELIKTDLGNVKVTENRTRSVTDIKTPLCYRGIVAGEKEKNNVLLTLNEDYFSFNASLGDRFIQLGKVDEGENNVFRLYNSKEVEFPASDFQCGTNKEPSAMAKAAMYNTTAAPLAPQDKCIYVFVECFDSLYQWRNRSIQQTIDYVYALYNNVATGFLNEQLNVKISTINVWTTSDPYRGDTRENALADLAAYYQDDFWGNICVGLDYSIGQNPGRSGIAGDIGRVKGEEPFSCPAYTVSDHPFCYNDLDYNVNVQNFPTGSNVTQQQVYLVMHEMGHLFGSSHTHWCGWLISTNPNTFGALDNCATVEGTCAAGPAPPASGGTIMSYCVGTGQFVNFNNGFGTLPGNAIRNFISNNNCVANCPSCPSTVSIGNIGTGVTHFEVSNTIFANGLVPSGSYATFDAGVRVTLSPGFRANGGARLKIIIDGCGGIR